MLVETRSIEPFEAVPDVERVERTMSRKLHEVSVLAALNQLARQLHVGTRFHATMHFTNI
jgi:hypothetical protein